MKKFFLNIFACAAIISVSLISCRQEDVISKEDNANLQVLSTFKNKASQKNYRGLNDTVKSARRDSLALSFEGDPFPPPKK